MLSLRLRRFEHVIIVRKNPHSHFLILMSVVKSENQLSYWGLVNHFVKYPSDGELCELKRLHMVPPVHMGDR